MKDSKNIYSKKIETNKSYHKYGNKQNMNFEKINKVNIGSVDKRGISNKNISPKRREPIKVKLTPIINRNKPRLNNNMRKERTYTYTFRRGDKLNNSLYLSPSVKSEDISVNDLKDKTMNYTVVNRNSFKKQLTKFNNCSTPYRRINVKSKREQISPSANVIIKNFNYNNVYNINIDNQKMKTPKVKKNYAFNNSKDRFSQQKFTYHKPKTTSNINIPCIVRREKSKEMNEVNDYTSVKSSKNKNETFYSRFISEGSCLRNCKDNIIINSTLISCDSKYDDGKKDNNKDKIDCLNKTQKIKRKNSFKENSIKINTNNFSFNNDNDNENDNDNDKNKDNNNSYYYQKIGMSDIYNTNKSLNNSPASSMNRNIIDTPAQNSIAQFDFKNDFTLENDNVISFNLNDLNIFEEKINDIINTFNKNINFLDEIETSNSCNEFINFYSQSTINGIFSGFFKDNNKLIIESSINLSLFSIIIIYHLSLNNFLVSYIIKIINHILFLLKTNFALYIKKIQINYNINIFQRNYIYFETFDNFLMNEKITDIKNEDDITYKIYQNCRDMTNDIKIIMEYYKNINTNYYNNFIKIFNNISIQNETELINYFFNKVIKNNDSLSFITVNKSIKNNKKIEISNMKHQLKRNKTNENLNIISPNQYPYKIKRNIFHNLSIKNMNNNITSLNHNNNILDSKSMHNLNNLSNLNNLNNLSKSNIYKKSIILKSSMKKNKSRYKNRNKNKIGIPYIDTPSNKKYTLILDINKTLGFNSTEKGIKLRNGLFSFFSMVKPYYELISFSCEPREVTDPILKEIESEKKYFDYNLNREHAFLYDNCLIKDISLIGRDISKIIVIDDDENSFKLNKNNGIKITPFNQESKNDNVLFELKKILILIYKKNYDDVRIGLKEFSNDIKNKVNLIE